MRCVLPPAPCQGQPLSLRCAFHGTQGEVVYTYVGDIIVSVNPFKNVGCVGKQIRSKVSRLPQPR